MAAAHQPLDHIRAHFSQAHHSDFHLFASSF
jgi:hypothetical protein